MSTPLSFELSYLQTVGLTSFYFIWGPVSHCVVQGWNEWCQRWRGPGSNYDVMSGRGILGFWTQIRGGLSGSYLLHIMPFTAARSPFTFVSDFQARKSHKYTHLFGTTKAHSYTNRAKSLTFTLLSILRHCKAGLTRDTRVGTICVCTCSLGACGGQRALINIWWVKMRRSQTSNTGKEVLYAAKNRRLKARTKKQHSFFLFTGCTKKKHMWWHAWVHLEEPYLHRARHHMISCTLQGSSHRYKSPLSLDRSHWHKYPKIGTHQYLRKTHAYRQRPAWISLLKYNNIVWDFSYTAMEF